MLSDKIRRKRQNKGLSQSELARRSGHAVSTIHGIENGDNRNPSFQTVCDIAKVLCIPLGDLYQETLRKKNRYSIELIDFDMYLNRTYMTERGGIRVAEDTFTFPSYKIDVICAFNDAIFNAMSHCIKNGFDAFNIHKTVKGKKMTLQFILPLDDSITVESLSGEFLKNWKEEFISMMRACKKTRHSKTKDYLERICFNLYDQYTTVDYYDENYKQKILAATKGFLTAVEQSD